MKTLTQYIVETPQNDTLLFTSRDATIMAEKILADERIVKRSQRYQETNEY